MSWQTPKTDWLSSDNPGPGDFNRIEGNTVPHGKLKMTESGTFIVPDNVIKVWVTPAGGGGGGEAGSGSGDDIDPGDPGFSGAIKWTEEVTVTPGESVTVTVGTGGSGGTEGAPGVAGGDTSFGSYITAAGGAGGGTVGAKQTREISINYGIGGAGSGGGYGTDGYPGTDGVCLIEW
jgi:hypothetical protein